MKTIKDWFEVVKTLYPNAHFKTWAKNGLRSPYYRGQTATEFEETYSPWFDEIVTNVFFQTNFGNEDFEICEIVTKD